MEIRPNRRALEGRYSAGPMCPELQKVLPRAVGVKAGTGLLCFSPSWPELPLVHEVPWGTFERWLICVVGQNTSPGIGLEGWNSKSSPPWSYAQTGNS